MKTWIRLASATFLAALWPVAMVAQETSLPTGVIEFAGKLAHNHWHVLGESQRAELDSINRELREAQQQVRTAQDQGTRQEALSRGLRAVERLTGIVKASSRLLKADLGTPKSPISPSAPVEQPGESGALLIEISAGGDGLSFTTGVADLSEPAGESSQVNVNAGSAGITYAVIGLERLPVGKTTLQLRFNRAGRPDVLDELDIVTPRPGRLKLAVLSDDTGEPVPAMVRLMWRTDGLQRRPANAIEFAPQFDRQGHASGVRAANLPGPLGVHFWCVPGPLDMTLSPGVWQIGVRRGVEHEALFEDVTVTSDGVVERTMRPRRWVDMRRHGYWSGDDHVHTRILSDEDARNVMAWIQAEDVHLANIVKMGDTYRTYFEQRGFGPAYRIAEGDYVLVPGQECPRTDFIGHTLAMNIKSMVRDTEQYFLYDSVFDAVHEQGGLVGYAHVNDGNFKVHRDMSLNVPRGNIDFVEILQFNNLGTTLYYEFLNLGCKLTASAGSDVPWGGTIGEVRAYAFLGDQAFSADNWFAAFGRGRTFTTSGPMIEFTVNEALPGDELRVSKDVPLRIKARAWVAPGQMSPVNLEVVRHGEVIQSANSGQSQAVSVDFTVPAGHGSWIAARARAADGTSAHTTPVYVFRDHLRFWKYESVDELLAQREDSLRQIEALVAELRHADKQGLLENDRPRRLLAQQSGQLLHRVETARQLYADLKRMAEEEQPYRR